MLLSYFQFFVAAKAVNLVGYPVGEVGDVAFVAADVEDVDGNLVTRYYPHLTGLCAGSHHMHLYLLTQSQERSPMPSRDDKSSFIAAHTMKLAALLKSAFHSRVSAASVLWKINGVGFAHNADSTFFHLTRRYAKWFYSHILFSRFYFQP